MEILEQPVGFRALETVAEQGVVVRQQLQLPIRIPLPRARSGDLDVPFPEQGFSGNVALLGSQPAERGEHDALDPFLVPATPVGGRRRASHSRATLGLHGPKYAPRP